MWELSFKFESGCLNIQLLFCFKTKMALAALLLSSSEGLGEKFYCQHQEE